MTKDEMTKSLPISKRMVWDSYLSVKSNRGGAGIDGETLLQFDVNMSKNLYKIWNRLSSGSYFPPPVRTVLIPKKSGGRRPLGIPTVSDRIAQGVVKAYLEPLIDPKFSESSYGYRIGRNAHQAIASCQIQCRDKDWVIDMDIKGFFDNLSHELLLKMLSEHTQEAWILLYVERWLKAGVEQSDGKILGRTKGTPQGGVISPLLANLYLHHVFDTWIAQEYPGARFERYADDIVVHCRKEEESKGLLEAIKTRMADYELELHPDKTKIVFCKCYYKNKGFVGNRSFTFLGFSFQPKVLKSKTGSKFLAFKSVVSQPSKQNMREIIRNLVRPRNLYDDLQTMAKMLNSRFRGWVNYYCKVDYWGLSEAAMCANARIVRWVANKYRIKIQDAVIRKMEAIRADNPKLFVHWQFATKTMVE